MKSARHKRTNTVGFHLDEVSRIVRFRETEGRTALGRGWGRGAGELVCTGTDFQFGKMKSSGGGGCGGCTSVNVLRAIQLYT